MFLQMRRDGNFPRVNNTLPPGSGLFFPEFPISLWKLKVTRHVIHIRKQPQAIYNWYTRNFAFIAPKWEGNGS